MLYHSLCTYVYIYIHIFTCICNLWSECNLLQVSFHIFSMSKPLCLFHSVLALSFILPLHAAMRPAGTWEQGRKNCDFFHSYCWWTKSSTTWWDKLLPSTGAGFWLFQPQQKSFHHSIASIYHYRLACINYIFAKTSEDDARWPTWKFLFAYWSFSHLIPRVHINPWSILNWPGRGGRQLRGTKSKSNHQQRWPFWSNPCEKKSREDLSKKKNKIQVWCYVLWSHQNLRKKQKTKK